VDKKTKVIPMKMGIQLYNNSWIPAFAGMTEEEKSKDDGKESIEDDD
jgi:hypothetical protein